MGKNSYNNFMKVYFIIFRKSKIEVLVVYCYDTGVGVYEIGENGDLIYKRTIPAPATMDNMWGRVENFSIK